VNYVFDACALINLANGGVLPIVLSIPANFYFIGAIVRDESGALEPDIDDAVKAGALQILDASKIPAKVYLDLLAKHELGEGETECMTVATLADFIVVSDDHRARTVIREELGANRVTGSIGLLRRAIQHGLIDRKGAYDAYQLMRATGAFLPSWSIEQAFPRSTI
jgi:predicted nucleic acid-binding protein